MDSSKKTLIGAIITGAIFSLIAVWLVKLGNPVNMGICTACFLRDTVGALGLHDGKMVQYARPEIIGLILGAFFVSLFKREHRTTGGSAPITRFILGACVMIGALIFLGCPLRMWLRMAGGDYNAIVGLVGFVAGLLVGMFFLTKGFTLQKEQKVAKSEGWTLPILAVILLVLVALITVTTIKDVKIGEYESPALQEVTIDTEDGPVTGMLTTTQIVPQTEEVEVTVPRYLKQTTSVKEGGAGGPGSMHAKWYWALLGGLIIGGLGYLYQICFVAGIRDTIWKKRYTDENKGKSYMIWLYVALLVVGIIGNMLIGKFKLGFDGQPIAHARHLWNFLGLFMVGFGSVLLGGCPFRQCIKAGSGNSDSTFAIFGMMFGAALAHNFGLASDGATANNAGGPGTPGVVVFWVCLIVMSLIAVFNTFGKKETA